MKISTDKWEKIALKIINEGRAHPLYNDASGFISSNTGQFGIISEVNFEDYEGEDAGEREHDALAQIEENVRDFMNTYKTYQDGKANRI